MFKLGHIGIIAKDPKALADWYKNVLGFEVILEMKREGRPPIYFLKGGGGSYIEVLPSTFETHLGFVVDNFDEAAKILESKGIVLENVRKTGMGWTIGYFRDSEGNQLEIVHMPEPL